jgi:mRNA-degrading endonuclease RelE of RelBE toxin-antitoxin system
MFEVLFSKSAVADLRYLRKADQNVVLDAIEQQLTTEPLAPARNRKPLRPNDLSAWEMPVGAHRVFYDVDDAGRKVTVKAVGWKEHNRLLIRGKEYKL